MEPETPPNQSILDTNATGTQNPQTTNPTSVASAPTRISGDTATGWVVTYPRAPISNVNTAVAQQLGSDEHNDESLSDEELADYLSSESDEEDPIEIPKSRLRFKSGVQKPLRIVSPPVRRRARASVAPQQISSSLDSNDTVLSRGVDALIEKARKLGLNFFPHFHNFLLIRSFLLS